MLNIIQLFDDKTWGSTQRQVLDLSRRFMTESDLYSVAVICRKNEIADRIFKSYGLSIGHLSLGGSFDIMSPILLAGVLNRIDDKIIVHAHSLRTASIAIRAKKLMKEPSKVRIVCSIHEVKAADTKGSKLELYRELNALIFDSQLAENEFLKSKIGVDLSKFHIAESSILEPTNDDTTNDEAAKSSIHNLIYVGKVCHEKGVETLVKALAKLSDIDDLHLTVCGTGKGSDVMPIVRTARGADVDKRISWLGHIDNVTTEIRKASIGILPSLRKEASAATVLEYMAAGIVPIAVNNGAQCEIINNGVNGLLVPPDDADALANAIRELLSNPEKMNFMAQNAKKSYSENHSFEAFFKKITDIYDSVR